MSSENLHEVKKTISGLSESLLLTTDGTVYSYGLDYIIPQTRFSPHPVNFQNKIVDCDIDQSHSIFLDDKNNVIEIGSQNNTY